MSELGEIQQALAKGELSLALRMLDIELSKNPDNADALYMQAVALRYSGALEQALAKLERLKTLSPTNSRAHQEEGHVYRDSGNAPQAIQAYARALALNPALDSCLRESIKLLNTNRQSDQAAALETQLNALMALPKPLRIALDLVAQNKLLKAEALCRQFLQQQPQNIQGMRILADIGIRLGVLEDAEFLLESALEFSPDDLPTHMEYVQILRKR